MVTDSVKSDEGHAGDARHDDGGCGACIWGCLPVLGELQCGRVGA